jgi:hypothetical protein
MRRLCTLPPLPAGPPVRQRGAVPSFVRTLQGITEEHRGLAFLRDVPVDVVDDVALDARVADALDATVSDEQLGRRTLAWRTIGVIPSDADLASAIRKQYEAGVLGFYIPETGELVVGGSLEEPTLLDGVVLVHELTHALDDQHFELVRVDRLAARCRDERFAAALGLVEGSAQYVAGAAVTDLQPIVGDLGTDDAGAQVPAGVPPFVQALQAWPYTAGPEFVRALVDAGGAHAVDVPMRDLPVSTEQILHPDRYPGDVPTQLDVPDVSAALGAGWRDVDVMEVGEAWLQLALELRVEGDLLDRAAPGWDGGIYRAWADGDRVAVWLRTAWDSPGEAEEFAAAMRAWIAAGSGTAEVASVAGTEVGVAFASDDATLETLLSAM